LDKITDAMLSLVFPKRCIICDDALPLNNTGVCQKCRRKIIYIKEPCCLKCGKPIMNDVELCRDCDSRRHEFVKGSALFDYGSVAESLHRFKNKNRAEYANTYAKMLYEQKKDFISFIKPDAFIPVPVHKSKLIKRGYNQALLIAKELSRLSGIPYYPDLIVREKKTSALKDLSLSQRQNNLKNAFKLTSNDVKLTTIVIIDDIYTTGSTIDEIAKTFRRNMHCDVYFLTLTIGRGI